MLVDYLEMVVYVVMLVQVLIVLIVHLDDGVHKYHHHNENHHGQSSLVLGLVMGIARMGLLGLFHGRFQVCRVGW